MVEHNIAFCVPTHNHPDTVDEVLGITLEMYDKYGIDIYVYDSSESDETKEIVDKYIREGHQNLFYIDYGPNYDTHLKAHDILSGYGWVKEYDYLFEIKDRAFFDESTISKIYEASKEGYDLIFLPVAHWPLDPNPQPSTEVYTDALSFFRDYGKMLPNMETTIVRWDTVLKNYDKIEFIRWYYEGVAGSFDHFNIIFEQLLKVESLRIKVLREDEVLRYVSQRSNSMWGKQIFEVWVGMWSRAVDVLPAYYDAYKAKVKKNETMQPVLFGSIYNLIHLIEEGLLTQSVIDEYRDRWKGVSDIPIECIEYLLQGQQQKAIKILLEKWIGHLYYQEVDEAYHMFYTNYWLEEILGKYDYTVMKRCFEVYKMELENGAINTIFTNIHSYKEVIDKYQTMKYLLRRLEYDCADEIVNDVVPYFYEQGFSVHCLSYIIYNECINQEKVIGYWEVLSENYNGGGTA